MFTIDPKSFRIAEQEEEERFVRSLVAFLYAEVPELASQPPQAMDAQVRLVIESARGYGLVSEQAIASYAITAALLGPDFPDRFPAAGAILLDPSIEARKVEALEAFTAALFEAME